MLKFKITPDRIAEACDILLYMAIQTNNMEAAIRALPRFLLDKDGEYLVKIVLDEDGDIVEVQNRDEALLAMSAITPKRSEKLAKELTEAVRNIVNPQNGRA